MANLSTPELCSHKSYSYHHLTQGLQHGRAPQRNFQRLHRANARREHLHVPHRLRGAAHVRGGRDLRQHLPVHDFKERPAPVACGGRDPDQNRHPLGDRSGEAQRGVTSCHHLQRKAL